ncbi:hypothetical protein DEJ16_12575 [Curtobacterium sp. MCJR17_055]|uniref:hypothetical protein n=1 Tax=unclassified Curtobacterium TaxID=257496 RepID=UPI000D99708B|nr:MULTISPECIES: hypothetical protein [unclassified Curtobacterium]PYY34084.1 hypothetical protein DEI87_10000 [Curtobacterium sp. MCBD17_029]PYY53934.1 hypothetical protein DEJ16_12575 [Curtobacterium sp. MCJR17_055]PYY59179.1 hypothetical protein DEJ26_09240 [Curtobacterium sp. MCPF17_015]
MVGPAGIEPTTSTSDDPEAGYQFVDVLFDEVEKSVDVEPCESTLVGTRKADARVASGRSSRVGTDVGTRTDDTCTASPARQL